MPAATVYKLDSKASSILYTNSFGTFDSFVAGLFWSEIKFMVHIALPRPNNQFRLCTYFNYGNTGCGVFKRRTQIQKSTAVK